MNYLFHLLIYLCIYAIQAMSLNIVMGYCGLFTLAHAGYFAIGAYTYAIATIHGLGFLPALILSVLVSSLLSFLMSLPAWRLKGDYFVLLSLSAQALIFSVLYNWYKPGAKIGSWANLTNGPFGISGVHRIQIPGFQMDTIGHILVVFVLVSALCCGITWLLLSSPWGRLMQCQRDDELAARSLGKNVRLVKIEAFAIACGLVAVAGVLYAAYVTYIDASMASLDGSILMTCMVIVGGLGNFRGPLVGASVLLAVPEALRFVHMPDAYASSVRLLLYGLLLVVMMHVRPQGLAGKYKFE
jgi:branched-chain amino acid transport system permease protein